MTATIIGTNQVPLRITRRSTRTFTIISYDVNLDEFGIEIDRERTDLTPPTRVLFVVRDTQGLNGTPDAVVISKSTDDIAEIEIYADQSTGSDGRGKASLKFVLADTSTLAIGQYSYDCWVEHADGREEPIVDRSKFLVDQEVAQVT